MQKHRQDIGVLQIFHELEKRIGDEKHQTIRERAVKPVGADDQFLVVTKKRRMGKNCGTLAQ